MFAWIAFILVDDLAEVDAILQHQVERAPGKRLSAMDFSGPGPPDLADDPFRVERIL